MRTGGKLWSLPSRAIGARPTPSRRQQPVGYFVHERQHSLTRICYVQRAQDMQICFPFTPFCFRYFTYLYELILLFPRFRCFRTRSYFPLRTLFPTRISAYRFTVLSFAHPPLILSPSHVLLRPLLIASLPRSESTISTWTRTYPYSAHMHRIPMHRTYYSYISWLAAPR